MARRTISIRLTDAELADIESRAAGQPVSAFIRAAALAKAARPAPLASHDLARIALHLQRHGADKNTIEAIRLVLAKSE